MFLAKCVHHQKRCQKTKFNCHRCGKCFSLKKDFEKHALLVGSKTCTFCDDEFCTQKDYLNHVKINHKDSKASYECSTCLLKFTSKWNLVRHTRLKHEAETGMEFVCVYCERKFKLKSNCKRHEKSCINK